MSAARERLADGAAVVAGLVPPQAVRRLPAPLAPRAQLVLNRGLKRRPRRFTGAPTAHGFTVDGSTADLIQRYLYVFGVWEPDTTAEVREHLRPGDVVVDVGANIGWFSLLAATCVGPSGRVLAFEPVPSIAEMLQRNVRRNGLPVEVHRVALGESAGEIEVFRAAAGNLGRSGTVAERGAVSEGRVPVVPAAEAVPRELWSRVRLVKVDVEGDEARVLRGLQPLLDAMPAGAAVLAEVTPTGIARRGGAADEVLKRMRAHGFDAAAVPNSYAPEHYARHVRRGLQPLTEPLERQTDVVFTKRQP